MRSFAHARPGLFLLMLLLVCSSGLGLITTRGVAQAAREGIWLSYKVGHPTAKVKVHGYDFGHNETVMVDFDDTTPIGMATTDATGGSVR